MDPAETLKLGLGTLGLHAGQVPDPTTGSRAMPIHQTTSYTFKSTEHAANLFALKEMGWIYTRLMNPTTDVLEQRLAAMEGGIGGLALASGQHAISVALWNLVHAGGHIVSAAALYGGTITLFGQTFKRLGIDVTFVDATDPKNIAAAIQPNTRAVYIESLANPKNDVLDYKAIADVAHEHGLPVVCDNTVLTPVLFKPFEHGIDHYRIQSNEVYRRAWDEHRRGDYRQRPIRLVKGAEKMATIHRAGCFVSRRGISSGRGAIVLHYYLPDALAARYRRCAQPVQFVFVPPRFGNAARAYAPALRKCLGRGEVLGIASAGHLGELSGLALAPEL